MSKSLSLRSQARDYKRGPTSMAARHAAARALGAASMLLGRLSAQLSAAAASRPAGELPPVMEFYASASAPEGALYLNGELVGYLPGVTRL